MYKEKETDARTFPQIWASLSANERDDLSYALIMARTTQTRQTIWNWANNKTSPVSPLIRNEVAKCVTKVIGHRVFGNTLFPSK